VVVADEPVGSPLVRTPDHVIAMSLPSADKYETLVKPGGYLVVDSTLISRGTKRSDIRLIVLPATTMATQLGDVRLVNMIMLGALMAATKLMPVAALEQALRSHLPAHNRHLLDANLAALQQGAGIVERLGEKD
jgi:2-oxoglutarate ferredoxin oxidoreductase subunit gamma